MDPDSSNFKIGFSDLNQVHIQHKQSDQPPSYQESASSPYPPQLPQQPQDTYVPTLDPNTLFQHIKAKYEISQEFGDKLQLLQGFKIAFIFDDSSSMNTQLQDSPLNSSNSLRATRWDELKYFANISVEIASLFDRNGCDIYFLNRPGVKNLQMNQLAEFLNTFSTRRPNGYTPLSKALTQVLQDNYHTVQTEQKLLIIIVTDGEPTDESGNVDIRRFKQCLINRTPMDRIFVTIVACTDDDTSIAYLNRWDTEIKHLDIVDDFRNEREEIRRARGPRFPFTYGDFVVKSLVGSIDPTLDVYDEKKRQSGCCSIS